MGPPKCATVTADGVPLGVESVAAFDRNDVGGVTALDGSLWARDLFSGTYFARSDYDGDGDIDGIDGALWAAVFFGGTSAVSCGPLCP